MTHTTTLHPDAIAAIIGGYHGDPFGILGRHIVNDTSYVRVFEPTALSIDVHENGEAYPLDRIHPSGFFEGVVPGQNSYILEISYPGATIQRPDTYTFNASLSDFDRYLLAEGKDRRMHDKLGAHIMQLDGVWGTRFAVWAPNAERVSVIGDFNQWDGRRSPMRFHPGCGVWELFVPGIGQGEHYKYELKTRYMGYMIEKADPVAFFAEVRPKTASVVWDVDNYEWNDQAWITQRDQTDYNRAPVNIYEMHLGSWQRKEGNRWFEYDEIIDRIIPYIKYMGYTHIELMPIAEHPFDGSWGYQVTGYFAATSRYGTPQQLMKLIDACHQNEIGVIIDWVPAHFPKDAHGLSFFDGTHLYEHSDPRLGEHPDWGTYIFNYGRNEIRQFLISNALFWIEKYHIDGLRVDAVASMLYLDYSRKEGQWVPNQYGGRENIQAINFLREFNHAVHERFPGALTIAEESTAWGGVTNSPESGGLGFNFKWNMGWMNDTLQYMSTNPIYRAYHHGTITFSMLYAFSERFILPFSHDEVVHGKGNLIGKMPGDNWQKFANLRTLYGYMYCHPGKKLLFMGSEFAQWDEWKEPYSLDWHLVQDGWPHKQMQTLVRDLNFLYREQPALHEVDDGWGGFEWLSVQDSANSVLAYLRRALDKDDFLMVACNFTPVVRHGYRLGVPLPGIYEELINTDSAIYGGSGIQNAPELHSYEGRWQEQPHSIYVTLPALSTVIIRLKSPL